MGDKLLVRGYNVGCGDCFYVRIPNGEDDFHMLIDCGSKESAQTKIMKRAIRHLEEEALPVASEAGKDKRLDLIVVTHRHEDHIKGFDPEYFEKITIKNIWITAAMNENHDQAKKSLRLHNYVSGAIQELAQSGASLSPELNGLVPFYSIGNEEATKTLTKVLPEKNNITPEFVFAGKTSDDYKISIKDTKITILAPEQDIDGYYLGEEVDESLRGMQDGASHFRKHSAPVEERMPTNITVNEFRTLQSRILSNSLAFAVDDSDIQNNVSTVLLIEWRKRRLLFVGDAMWEEEYKEGIKNGSWNVMWNKRKKHLSKPVDFLKVGHHGSHNSTPWNRHAGNDQEVNQIFNAILPSPNNDKAPTAKCIVSTKRKQYDTIPDAELLVEIGKRVCNTKSYLKEFRKNNKDFDPEKDIYNYSIMKKYKGEPTSREVGDKGWLDHPQPIRTDMESVGRGQKQMLEKVEYIDVFIDPGN